jgi:hypothetical protein
VLPVKLGAVALPMAGRELWARLVLQASTLQPEAERLLERRALLQQELRERELQRVQLRGLRVLVPLVSALQRALIESVQAEQLALQVSQEPQQAQRRPVRVQATMLQEQPEARR